MSCPLPPHERFWLLVFWIVCIVVVLGIAAAIWFGALNDPRLNTPQ